MINKLIVYFIAVIALCLPATVYASDWPINGQNQFNHNSIVEQPEPPFSEVAKLSNQVISPVVSGNILLTFDSDLLGNKLVAYRLNTQQVLWVYRLPKLVPRQPTIYRGSVYFGIITQPTIYSVDLLSGQLNWTVMLSDESFGTKFAPFPSGEGVVVAGNRLHLISLSGQEQWYLPYNLESAPAADDSYIYARTHDLKLLKLNRSDGSQVWRYITPSTDGTAPIIAGASIYFGAYEKIISLDSRTGQQRWVYDLGQGNEWILSVAMAGSSIFASSSNGLIIRLSDLGRLIWQYQIPASQSPGNGWLPYFLMAGDRLILRNNFTGHLILSALDGSIIFQGSLSQPSLQFKSATDQYLLAIQDDWLYILQPDHWTIGTLGKPILEKRIDPILIVPGILESWPVLGTWQLDPVTHSYDNLIATLQQAGYVLNQNLFFTLPYDWHQSNTITAQLISAKVTQIRQQTGSAKVDIIAHSMGNLAVRSYIQSNDYHDDIDEVVAVTPPNHGASQDYLLWEAGETGTGHFDRLTKSLLGYESIKNGYGASVVNYVHDKILSSRDILPVTNYLIRDQQTLAYLPCVESMYPCNSFLEQLNQSVAKYIGRINSITVVGSLKTSTTVDKIMTEPSNVANLWRHGMPIGYPNTSSFLKTAGDGVVTLYSAHFDGIEEKSFVSGHSEILSDAASYIAKRLSDRDVSLVTKKSPIRYLFVKLFSPIHLHLTDTAGHEIGVDPSTQQTVNTIPGAFYGGQTNEEYAILPDPDQTQYKLDLNGLADDSYEVTADLIDDSTQASDTASRTIHISDIDHYTVDVAPATVTLNYLNTQSAPAPTPAPTCLPPAQTTIGPP